MGGRQHHQITLSLRREEPAQVSLWESEFTFLSAELLVCTFLRKLFIDHYIIKMSFSKRYVKRVFDESFC